MCVVGGRWLFRFVLFWVVFDKVGGHNGKVVD